MDHNDCLPIINPTSLYVYVYITVCVPILPLLVSITEMNACSRVITQSFVLLKLCIRIDRLDYLVAHSAIGAKNKAPKQIKVITSSRVDLYY